MTARPVRVTASILSCDLAHLQEEVDAVAPFVDGMQVDVMDGHFVPNLTFGAPVIKYLQTTLPLDIHLMVTNPEDRLAEFITVGAKHITFHAEAAVKTADRLRIIDKIHQSDLTAGIAINPGTPVSAIDDVLDRVDLVLVMSIQPGFSGQPFMEDVLGKVRELRGRFPGLRIQMDGGISDRTAPLCREAGADDLVSASYLFGAEDRAAAAALLRGI